MFLGLVRVFLDYVRGVAMLSCRVSVCVDPSVKVLLGSVNVMLCSVSVAMLCSCC